MWMGPLTSSIAPARSVLLVSQALTRPDVPPLLFPLLQPVLYVLHQPIFLFPILP